MISDLAVTIIGLALILGFLAGWAFSLLFAVWRINRHPEDDAFPVSRHREADE